MIKKNKGIYTKIPHLRRFVLQNFPFIEEDFDALTDYELLCKVVEYLNKVITSQNALIGKVEELEALFNQLHDYVEHYFDNLNIQDEINKKLDQMVEDGTFEALLDKLLIKENIFSPLALKNFHDLVYADSDTFQGYEHNQAQGCVVVGNSVIVALRNYLYHDNYVRLVEYDFTTNTIVREKYVILNHANSMSYDEENGLIYVSATNKVVSEGVIEADNTIFVMDYQTLTVQSSFIPTNIPENGRIRSVTYDNLHKKLYAGDVFNIYEIDIQNQSVVNNIELEKGTLGEDVANQTFNYYNGKFYGVFLTFIGVWSLDGTLIKVLNMPTDNLLHVGEPQDISFINETGDMIFVSAKRYNPRQTNRVTTLSYGNVYKSVNYELNTTVGGADTSNIALYVDADYTGEELGTSDKPFKSLAKAVGVAKQWNKGTDIVIKSGNYEYTYLNQISNIVFNIAEDGVVINGLELRESNLTVLNSTRLTINYCYLVQHSNIILGGATINQLNGTGYALRIEQSSSGQFTNTKINGSNNSDTVLIDGNCLVSFRSPTLSGYDGHYAFNITSFSRVCVYDPTFTTPPSVNQKVFFVNAQSECLCDPRTTQAYYMWTIQGQGRKNPSILSVPLENPVYIGDICDLDYAYTHAQLTLKVCGTNGLFTNVDIDLLQAQNNTNGLRVDMSYPNTNGLRTCNMYIKVSNGKITIPSQKMGFLTANSWTFEDVTETPQSTQNYGAVTHVKFFNK